ncbi:Putative fatty acyl-CoA reductase CG5065 [Eumeta japonica]|uniref:Fatty acyl-CoA reductase n=1 Tax=Eumeta variegata TaxID=151549 RepID=A0A4C1WPV7_EUMVA|nr:Putative fatty acyl-CoA reductase CG5065 [Eumeta japonica]
MIDPTPPGAELRSQRVSVVFHFAATLKLEAPLKVGLEMNTRGTQRVLEVVKGMKNLAAFIHLSTAFCYPDYVRLEEKVHNPPVDPHQVLQAASWLTEEQMSILTPSILHLHPNSYTYSKRLAEVLVSECYPQLPAAIVRPSIVTPAYQEPIPGWVDNLNGPIGLMVGAGKGVIRPSDIPVYNITTGDDRTTTWKDVLDIGKATGRKYPFEGPLWYPNAYFIDFLMLIFGQKRFMVRIQKRISVGLEVLQYFTTREWWFNTDNFKSLSTVLNPEDNKTFSTDISIIEDVPYIENSMIGGKIYCLKEKMENLPKARFQNNVLYVLDLLVTVLFYLYVLSLIASYSETVRQILKFGGPVTHTLPFVGKTVFI